MERRGGAADGPRGPKRTCLPVVAHAENVPPLLNKTRERLLAGFFFWDHGGPPPPISYSIKNDLPFVECRGGGRDYWQACSFGTTGGRPPPISYLIRGRPFVFDQRRICLWWNAEGAGETTGMPVLLGPRGPPPFHIDQKGFASGGTDQKRICLLWNAGAAPVALKEQAFRLSPTLKMFLLY